MRFNLTEQPWLPVVRMDGTRDEVDLVTLLSESHRIRRILGQSPPMTAALHRLVLALMHRVYGPADEKEWAELWRAESLPDPTTARPGEPVPRLQADRFELFDAERPFLQCPAVSGVPASSAAKLVPHRAVGNNTTLFDHTTALDEVRLSPAEAARWLVTLQAYDPGGMKTPYARDKSSQAAPANSMGMVLVEGRTLKETLLLNLMPYQPGESPRTTDVDDRPAWEAPPPRPEPEQRPPKGWTDLLTWPSRRVWLVPRKVDGETYVDRVVITPGTRLSGELEDNEWMAAHRRPKIREARSTRSGTTKPKYGPWYAVRLQEHRGVWRFSQELLLAPVGSEERRWQRPLTLDHVARMVMDRVIPRNAVYTLRVFGQQLDSKGSVVQQAMEETVAAPVALLRADHPVAGPVIGHSIELANLVGSALNQMDREHRAQFKAAASVGLDLAYWPLLSGPFDTFLQALARALEAGINPRPATDGWERAIWRIATEAAERWSERSLRQGRNLEVAGQCYEQFLEQLRHEIHTYHGYLARYFE
ncbi:type I-E CRISPR-associated protein Cse1/CasA [Micromonospora sp. NPDC051296]|uniref:type I-E CRISPR-associated protein Cse1/CasA n=1 Tax=Micromonospora sp. NPDC051296 TaxID=3155046 RepID=UPI003435F453